MKILHTADWHIGQFKGPVVDGVNLRSQDNGVNGAGKSSLFMDAIVDCLFEETREGDNKAWIRGTEDARSGSIEFVFDIGDKRFRVVRTRTKSGKPTLNLSQYEENEWRNISKERIADTQAEIEKLLGMDSMTFRRNYTKR